MNCASLGSASGILTVIGSNIEISDVNRNRGTVVILSGAPFCKRNNNRINSANIVRSNDFSTSISGAAGGPSNAVCLRTYAMGDNDVGMNTRISATISRRHHTSVAEGRATTRLLRSTLHRILNGRIRRTNRLISSSCFHFSFARFRTLATGRLVRIRGLIGGGVLRTVPIAARRVPVRRTGGLNTVTLFNRGCNSIIHIMDTNSFSIRFYNNARMGGATGLNLFEVERRNSITTNMEEVRTLANVNILGCVGNVDTIVVSIYSLLGVTGPGTIIRNIRGTRRLVGRRRERVGRLGSGLTITRVNRLFTNAARRGNMEIMANEVSGTGTSVLHAVYRGTESFTPGYMYILTARGSNGIAFTTTYNGRTLTLNTGTNGVVGTITRGTKNGKNKGPSVTVTNTGRPRGVSRTLSDMGRAICTVLGWSFGICL